MNQEVRKLPKKTVTIIAVMIIIAIAGFLFLKNLKEAKLSEVVATLGHTNIKNMQVINKLEVEDKVTRYKSTVFKVKFFDINKNKTCIGFIHFKRDHKFSEDLECK